MSSVNSILSLSVRQSNIPISDGGAYQSEGWTAIATFRAAFQEVKNSMPNQIHDFRDVMEKLFTSYDPDQTRDETLSAINYDEFDDGEVNVIVKNLMKAGLMFFGAFGHAGLTIGELLRFDTDEAGNYNGVERGALAGSEQ